MNELIQKWLNAKEVTRKAYKAENKALDEAEKAKLPERLIKAQAKDIVEGSIIWYPEWYKEDKGCCMWKAIEEVLHPNSDWKAYCAQDGCRYGLDGAFVEAS
tara:strand:- start:33447 stop:33752 length:306 start_codon:yes stop_codon:yes gene_type:complete